MSLLQNYSSTTKEENDDLLSVVCPHCYKIPRILIIPMKTPKVLIKCSCGIDKSLTLEKYLQFLKTNNDLKKVCTLTSKHYNKIAVSYCVNCEKYMCNDCKDCHNELLNDHSIRNSKIKINSYCKEHVNMKTSFYCMDCKEDICEFCIKNHQLHQIIENKGLDSKFFEKLNRDYSSAFSHVYQFHKKIYSKTITLIKNEMNKITNSYYSSLKANELILEMIKILINNSKYVDTKTNNITVENINNNRQFNKSTIEIRKSSSLSKITESVFNYFESFYILKYNYDLNQHNEKQRLVENGKKVTSIILLQEGNIAYSVDSSSIDINNIYTNEKILSRIHNTSSICLLPNGNIISSYGKEISVIRFEDDLQIYLSLDDIGTVTKVTALTNDRFASCYENKEIKIWEVNKLLICTDEEYEVRQVLKKHTNPIKSIIQLKWKNVLVSSDEKMIIFWDLNTYKLIEVINFLSDAISVVSEISQDKITVLSKGKNRYYIINTSSYQIESVINYKSNKNKEGEGVVVSFDEYNLLCCLKNDSFDLFNLTSFIHTNYKEEKMEQNQENSYNRVGYNTGSIGLFGGYQNNSRNNNLVESDLRDFTNVIKINTNTIAYALGSKVYTNTLDVN